MIKLESFQGGKDGFNICKSISVIHHNNKRKDKKTPLISIDSGKAFDKIQHPLMINNSPKWQ